MEEFDAPPKKVKKPKKSCNEAAILLVGRRSYSVLELQQKLLQKNYTEEEVQHTLARLKELNYVNDAQYAKHFVADKARLAGWGALRIEMALRQKQIPEKFIKAALEAYEEKIEAQEAPPWLEVATEKLMRRYGTFAGHLESADFQKRMNFLLRRGYNLDQAKKALENTRVNTDS